VNSVDCRPPLLGLGQRVPVFWMACGLLYILLSGLDLYLTWVLVGGTDLAHEGNPVAAFILNETGWLGLSVFKSACVAFVLVVGVGLWQCRPRTARGLVGFACLSSLAVVGYSLWILEEGSEDFRWCARLACAEKRYQTLQRTQRQHLAYRAEVDRLTLDLVSGQCTLAEASAALNSFLREIHHDPFHYLHTYYPNLEDDEACLAAHLVRQVGLQVAENPELARQQWLSLVRQFAVYQAPLPELSSEPFTKTKAPRGAVALQ
jgi:hypothetical protein